MNTTLTRTADLKLASYLLARGHPLIGTEQNGSRKIIFIIDVPESEVRTYYGPEDTVSAKRLFESWRALRDLLPEVRR